MVRTKYKNPFIMNLQLFAEGEEEDDPILPDDFEEDEESFEDDEVNEDEENADELEDNPLEEEENQEEQQGDIPTVKLLIGNEEKEMTLAEAQALAQKGMQYDEVQERLNSIQNNPGLSYLEQLAERNGMTVDELVNHWQSQEEEQALNELIQKNIPEEYAREMLENRKFRKEYQERQTAEKQKSSQDAEFKDFFDAFPDADPKEIPKEVWAKNAEGVPLKYAYMEHQMSQVQRENKILKQNQTNKKKAPIGGVSGQGLQDKGDKIDPFLEGFDSEFND